MAARCGCSMMQICFGMCLCVLNLKVPPFFCFLFVLFVFCFVCLCSLGSKFKGAEMASLKALNQVWKNVNNWQWLNEKCSMIGSLHIEKAQIEPCACTKHILLKQIQSFMQHVFSL